jgi:colanic acid biosynthesis glycosyl transferase WcaI
MKLLYFFSEASKKIDNTVFHFFSEGETIKKLESLNKSKKILFHKLVNKENLEELYSKSTIQIVPQKENTSKGSLPSKIPNLLASGCKVFVITDANSEIEKLFINNKLSLVVTNWNNDFLVEKLVFLINKQIDKQHQQTIAKKLFTMDEMILKILR